MRKKTLLYLLTFILLCNFCKSQSTKCEFKIDVSLSELWISQSQFTDVIHKLDSIDLNGNYDSTFQPTGNFKIVGLDTLYQLIKYRKSKTEAFFNMTASAAVAPTITEEIVMKKVVSEDVSPSNRFEDKSTQIRKIVSPVASPMVVTEDTGVLNLKVDNNKIKFGTLVYYIPDTMVKKKTYTIRLRINRDTLDKSILLVNTEKIESTIIKTTSKMEVIIVDPSPPENKSFEIVKSNDDKQIVDDDSYTEWIYNVTPLRHGNLKLNIIISIVREGDKKQVVYFKDIRVKSNARADFVDFIKKYWQWMISTLIIPLIMWWWKNRKKKRVGRPRRS